MRTKIVVCERYPHIHLHSFIFSSRQFINRVLITALSLGWLPIMCLAHQLGAKQTIRIKMRCYGILNLNVSPNASHRKQKVLKVPTTYLLRLEFQYLLFFSPPNYKSSFYDTRTRTWYIGTSTSSSCRNEHFSFCLVKFCFGHLRFG